MDLELPHRGIALAHKQIISWAKQNKQKEVLIAEDDIQFSDFGAFTYFISQKPIDFDLYLGGITWGTVRTDNTVADFSGTMLYAAHERFYDAILSLDITRDYDRAMAGLGRFVVCSPMVACQHSGFSDNQRRFIDFAPTI